MDLRRWRFPSPAAVSAPQMIGPASTPKMAAAKSAVGRVGAATPGGMENTRAMSSLASWPRRPHSITEATVTTTIRSAKRSATMAPDARLKDLIDAASFQSLLNVWRF